ncbi:MAG: MarR family transcriptional regulator [Rhizobium sp.]|nr:MarR family transcriptional regulator [Rhizobium sp.]
MADSSIDDSHDLIQLISGVNRRLEQAIEARLKPSGVAIEQYRVLKALDVLDGQPMGELAAQVFVDSPTLTKIIDRMIANADVYRAPDPHDRRRVLIFRSDKGAATYRNLQARVDGYEKTLVGQLERDGAGQLRVLLESLLRPTDI